MQWIEKKYECEACRRADLRWIGKIAAKWKNAKPPEKIRLRRKEVRMYKIVR